MDFGFERRNSTRDQLPPGPRYKHPVTFHYEIHNYTTRMQRISRAIKVYRLTALTLICVLAGILLGLLLRLFSQNWTERQFMYIEMPGELLLRLLKLITIPLLVSNVILSFGSIQGKLMTQLSKLAGSLYLCCNILAVAVAILVAVLLAPGKRVDVAQFDHKGGLHHNNHASDGLIHMSTNNMSHQTTEYYDSIRRYREYHPMFYHTDNEPHMVATIRSPRQQVDTSSELDSDIIKMDENRLKSPSHSSGLTDAFVGDMSQMGSRRRLPIDVLLDVLRNLVPDNIIGATIRQTRTRLFMPNQLTISKNGSMNPSPSHWHMGHEVVDHVNVIGLLSMSVLTGYVLSHMDEASKPMLDLCACISELSLRVNMFAISLAPVCIMFLIIGQVARSRDLSTIAGEICMYSMTSILALILYGAVVVPLFYYLITKKSPVKFLLAVAESLLTSFATSSSSASMALILNALHDADLNPMVIKAFGPLGSVFNMNGTAIYETIGAIFIAQQLGVSLTPASLLLVGFSASVASLGTTGIPSSGLVTIMVVLNAINLPVLPLSLIYIVDFIVDRFRTVVNVWSGAIVCAIIDHKCPERLFEEKMGPDRYREMVKLRQHNARRSLSQEENSKPQVISVTITPPTENCNT